MLEPEITADGEQPERKAKQCNAVSARPNAHDGVPKSDEKRKERVNLQIGPRRKNRKQGGDKQKDGKERGGVTPAKGSVRGFSLGTEADEEAAGEAQEGEDVPERIPARPKIR